MVFLLTLAHLLADGINCCKRNRVRGVPLCVVFMNDVGRMIMCCIDVNISGFNPDLKRQPYKVFCWP